MKDSALQEQGQVRSKEGFQRTSGQRNEKSKLTQRTSVPHSEGTEGQLCEEFQMSKVCTVCRMGLVGVLPVIQSRTGPSKRKQGGSVQKKDRLFGGRSENPGQVHNRYHTGRQLGMVRSYL